MDSSKILITGAGGQLGKALCQLYPEAKALNSQQLDVADKDQLKALDWSSISVIINAAAYTNVDGAETEEGRVAAWRVNATGASNLARIAQEKDLTLVLISTDYVFDGTKNPHTEDEPLSPLSSYGASKAAGDVITILLKKYYLVRSTWLVGDGKNFVRTMLDLGRKGVSPTVVNDQIGRPTLTSELVRGIDHLLQNNVEFGIYNLSNEGEPVTWADFTRLIFKEAGFDLQVTNTTTEQYSASKPGVAKRPLNSVFDLAKLKATGFTPKDWREDLKEYIKKEMERE